MIRVLTNVILVKLSPQIGLALRVAECVWQKYGADVLWITSANDGTHKAGSFHAEGLAVDLRVKNLPQSLWETAVNELQASLGSQYDVLLETVVGGNVTAPHVHVEFDPTHINR